MKKIASNISSDFVDSLYRSLKHQVKIAMIDRDRLIRFAENYIEEGLTSHEAIELLMIEGGINRESATSYVQMAESEEDYKHSSNEYSFQFEDVYGKNWTSFDIGKRIYASNDEEAWEKAERAIDNSPDLEIDRVVSVTRMS